MTSSPDNLEENSSTISNTTPLDLDETTGTSGLKDKEPSLETKPFNREGWRERTRTILAIVLLLNIGLTQLSIILYLFSPHIVSILGTNKNNDIKDKDNDKDKDKDKDLSKNLVKINDSTFIYIINNDRKGDGGDDKNSSQDSKELITLIWTSQVTLVGGALGFYFASSQGKNI